MTRRVGGTLRRPMTPADALRPATRRYLRAYPSASLCVGMTRGGEHHVLSLRARGEPAAPDALYALGALTQVLTGSLLALLVERGDLLTAGTLPGRLRSNDAIHVAVALRVGADETITCDRELEAAAVAAGLSAAQPT